MSFWSFNGKLYVFGGYPPKKTANIISQINLGDQQVRSVEIEGLTPRFAHSTAIIHERNHQATVFFMGGID